MKKKGHERTILWCDGCKAEGCSCFHPPNSGAGATHQPGCERGKDKEPKP